MLEAQAAGGVTHALLSDSFYMASAAEALPSWSAVDRARLYNVWSAPALRLLLDVLGPTPLVARNDQPPVWFPLAESLDLLDSPGLPPDQRDAIRWGNAARLFRLPVPAAAVASA